MNALEIKNLTVSFLMYDKGIKKKALQVISDLNITLKAGEIHAIAGSSGSGKTCYTANGKKNSIKLPKQHHSETGSRP